MAKRPLEAVGSSAGVEGFSDHFRLSTKGMVFRDLDGASLAGIGVSIFTSSNHAVLEVSEPLGSREGEVLTDEVAELEAFVRGLEIAHQLQFRIIFYTSVFFNVHSYLTGRTRPQSTKAADLVNRAIQLRGRFYRCRVSYSTRNNRVVVNLATSAIQIQLPTAKTVAKATEKCGICLDDEVNPTEMLGFCRQRHRFCSSCTKTHIQLKVRDGELPKCPEHKCGALLRVDLCKTLLNDDKQTCDMMDRLVKMSSIPAKERVYCPNPKCSYLMSTAEAFATREIGPTTTILEVTACNCVKCGLRFCIRCRVMWHSNMSCQSYKIGESMWNSKSDDAKLKTLAGKEKWKECSRCSHMVELKTGCNHISCRCGHEFCYVCGKEWRKKRATCSCPLWDEANIISGRRRRHVVIFNF